jgi:periplasmic divalent cation tolerance protein
MHIVIFITVGGGDDAAKLAKTLVEEELAACVNIIPSVRSVFRWQGKIDESNEALLIVKSIQTKLDDIVKRVKELHSYSNPEVIAFNIVGGSGDYLDWVASSVKQR